MVWNIEQVGEANVVLSLTRILGICFRVRCTVGAPMLLRISFPTLAKLEGSPCFAMSCLNITSSVVRSCAKRLERDL
jgi:hypothetical protein